MFIAIVLCTVLHYQARAQKVFELMQDDHVKIKQLERVGKRYFQNRDKGRGSGYKLYMRKLYWAKRNAGTDGRVISDAQVLEERQRFQRAWINNPASHSKRQRSSGWRELGPFNWTRTQSWSPGLGRIVSIAVEPSQQNIMYAGSPGGGIWKSVNAGQSWQPLGDRMTNMSIWSIAIDPNNVNTVFLGNSAGQIMKSTNGGSTWSEIYRVSGTPRRILIHPGSSRIFVGTTRALYRSTNGGSSFSVVLNTKAEDVEFKPGNTNIVYACGNSFYRSTNGGSSFSRVTSGIVSSERLKMAVTPANPDLVYLVQKRGSSFGYLYRSSNSGASFSVRSNYSTVSTSQVYFTQASRDMAITVSNTNANEVHVGGMDYSRSLDGGVSFTKLAAWNAPNDRSYIHADVEVLQYVNGTIYAGTDGGIFRSRDRGNNMADLTQGGLAVRQYYRIGGAATDANMIVGGAQDNGTNIMSGSNRTFKEWLGADGMECFIDHKNKNVVYGTTQFGNLYKSTNGGNSIGNISKPGNFSGEWVTPFMIDPIDNRKIYVGYNDLYRSTNGGSSGSWRNITQSLNIGGKLDEMAIAASNNNYIYIAERGRLWRTKNGQSSNPTWVEISNFSGDVNFIAVDPTNPERVAIATTGSRVYKSENAGSSWTNIRRNLPNISALCVVFDDTPANGLYVGMQSGVYYTNDNLSGWVPFSTNLPGVQTSELEIHYGSRKIRVATYGRGIWEADLYDEVSTGVNAPSNLTAEVNNQNVTLSWRDNSNNEGGFTIERSNGGDFERIDFVGTNTTTFTDAGLAEGTYTYRVRAYDSNQYSDYSNSVQAVIGSVVTEINPPSNLVAQVNAKDVVLTWQDNSNNENGFTIERSNGGAFERIDFVGTNTTTFTDANLATGTYTYRVRAYDSEKYSAYSNTVAAVVSDVTSIVDNCDGCRVYRTNSEETERADQGKEKAADGDLNTYWHTNWYDDNSSHPHYIAIDLGQERDLVGFSYQGRQTGTTGMVKDYVFFGWDGSNWQQLSTGSFQKSTLKQTVDFAKFRCRYVYFRALSEVDDKRWASVAELTVRYERQTSTVQAQQEVTTDEVPPKVDLHDFSGIKVFPVPFSDQLNIQGITSRKAIRSIRLIGVDGVIHRAKVRTEGTHITVDTSKLPKGFYILYFEKNGVAKKVSLLKR
ncbi:hypothetical protein BKI52_39655 [marine bacterium AO1-C]|nr:hypothetical protein BKI52_39655 [marine bacterium AO1-C]